MAIYSKVLMYMGVYTYTYIRTGPNRPDISESLDNKKYEYQIEPK